MRSATSILLTLLLAVPAPIAQAPARPQFAVASVKRDTGATNPMNAVSLMVIRDVARAASNGRFVMRGLTAAPLHVLIQLAYDVNEHQVLSGPEWVRSDRYEIDARADGTPSFSEMRPMLQSLLEDRFKLVVRRETRELPVYELIPAGDGLKISPTLDGSCVPMSEAKPFTPLNVCGGVRRQIVGSSPRKDVIEAVAVPIARLIDLLSTEVDRPIVDRTAFTSLFNFRIEFASGMSDTGVLGLDTSGPSIFSALEEQLGLRLRTARAPFDALIIDHVERASPN
jgi:uncharacterized protein (TIGR03435 family)